ncbi:MAG: UvrB/UvrC motif-containing protein, partial [Marinobacter sp.]|nr:UvrB/UvrC motif-containing protein [Marinobacter sp.]
SMQRAIDETERRRAKQAAHNEEHGITPQGLNKKIADIMEGASGGGGRGRRKAERPGEKAAEEAERYRAKTGNRSPEEILKEITRLEDDMYKAAADLDFETAARLRDDISELKEAALRTG